MGILSISELRELLSYDPETGEFRWKTREPKWFADTGRGGSAGACARWNARFAGKPALNHPAKTGHLAGAIFRVGYRAPRVAWAFTYDRWPTDYIDHINGNPRDNRITNLRDVPQQINMLNRAKQMNNTSGVTGVCRAKERWWWASIKYQGKRKHLGYFENFQDAVAARRKAEKELGFNSR